MNIHLFEFSLICSHRLLNQCNEVSLSNFSERWQVLNDPLSTLCNLANKVCVNEFILELQVIPQQLIENAIELSLALLVNQSVFEDSR